VLNIDCAAQGIDDAGELDQKAVPGGLDEPATMSGDPGLLPRRV
jgi:hypothetical protein